MGWTILYIAFGIVALWLLGEVLLQYKARLRWRLLAFVGFLGVVLGVLIPSVVVIGAGAAAFAVGQTYVTLSFRRGFTEGWALRGRDSNQWHEEDEPGAYTDAPPPADYDYQEGAGQDGGRGDAGPELYSPEPMPADSNRYGVYGDNSPYDTAAAAAQSSYGAYSGYGQDAFGEQGTYADAGQAGEYAYGTAQYAGYSDPYAGAGAGDASQHGQYAQAYDEQQYGYGTGQYAGDSYGNSGTGQYGETPPGGVWTPQEREGEQPPVAPDEQPYPYQSPYQQNYGNSGYGGQYGY
jgi:hypothetical protein